MATGPNLVQLLEPLGPESPVAKQLEKNGGRGGLAHVAFRVADIDKAFDYLKENGFKIIDKAPRKGSRGTTVFFVHPKTTETAAFGYLLEVVQEGAACLTTGPGAEILNLGQDFPPVATAAWEAAIQKDLKGADYEKKLVWRSDEGLAVRPYYRQREHSPGSKSQTGVDPRTSFPLCGETARPGRSIRSATPAADAIRADLVLEAGADAIQQLGDCARRGRGTARAALRRPPGRPGRRERSSLSSRSARPTSSRSPSCALRA